MRRQTAAVAFMLVLAVTCTVADAEVRYSITDLGSFGAQYIGATAVNESAQVVGSSTDAGNRSSAFLWQNGALVDLGLLAGYDNAFATGINDAGTAVGGSYRTPSSYSVPVVFSGGGVNLLSGWPSGTPHGGAKAINNRGQIIAGELDTAGYIWENGVVTALLPPASGGLVWIRALNDLGEVVGSVTHDETSTMPWHAVVWRNAQPEVLGLLDPYHGAEAYDINEAGQVVGWAHGLGTEEKTRPEPYSRAVLWQNGVAFGLDPLGYQDGKARAINNSGQIVGSVGIGGIYAALWDDGVGYRLNSLIAPGQDWLLRDAYDINNKGWIVGYGYHSGEYRAFLLTPVPEPCSLLALLGGVGVLAGVWRRRRR